MGPICDIQDQRRRCSPEADDNKSQSVSSRCQLHIADDKTLILIIIVIIKCSSSRSNSSSPGHDRLGVHTIKPPAFRDNNISEYIYGGNNEYEYACIYHDMTPTKKISGEHVPKKYG